MLLQVSNSPICHFGYYLTVSNCLDLLSPDQAGYQVGLTDYAQDPRAFDKELMRSIVKSSGARAVFKKSAIEVNKHPVVPIPYPCRTLELAFVRYRADVIVFKWSIFSPSWG